MIGSAERRFLSGLATMCIAAAPLAAFAAGDGFEDAALEAVRGFRYAPKFVDGEAVAVEDVRNLMRFEIRTM